MLWFFRQLCGGIVLTCIADLFCRSRYTSCGQQSPREDQPRATRNANGCDTPQQMIVFSIVGRSRS
jgi:hypothetical protein